MNDAEMNTLRAAISSAAGSTDKLRRVFNDAVSQFGRDQASSMWWSAFAENDATET